MTIQHTYHGQTAGGMLRRAMVAQTCAGDWQVWIDGAQVALTDADTMVLHDISGPIVNLEMSAAAKRKLYRLIAQADAHMTV